MRARMSRARDALPVQAVAVAPMTLPFVSRTSFRALERHCERLASENRALRNDVLAIENEWLKERVEALIDDVTRLARRNAGMTEVKPPERNRRPVVPRRSAELQAFIGEFDQPAMREDLDRRAEALMIDGHSEESVIQILKGEYGIE